jgi:phytanoyl-CoA hydroxylase
MEPLKLSDTQLADYRREGYVKLGRLFDEGVIAQHNAYLAGLPRRPGDSGTYFYTQMRGQNQLLREFASRGPQIAAMNQIIGPNLRCWFDQFVVKPAHSDAGVFPWHQDNGYNGPTPDNNVTVWIALDETTLENGCIWVIPRSHRNGLIPHRKSSPDSWHIEVDAGDDGVPLPLKPGEAVAFTGWTLHRSMGNRTDKPRRAFFLQYCDADAVFADGGLPINQKPTTDLFAGGLSPVITGVSKFE